MWGPPRKVQIRRPFDHNSYITLITGRAISDDPFLRPDLESHLVSRVFDLIFEKLFETPYLYR